ncbi:MAG: helix-turn-helix transcriptional regulator, partial [Clostridiaceae bacterium]|nr:helix-turn-helix transcriptional regulator [Clostridiaceae bacterium]
MEIAQSIGQRIKIMRKAKNLTLKQLSEMTDLSSGFLSQFERGMTNIAIDSLNRIAVALGVPLDSLLKLQRTEPAGIKVVRS